MKKITIAWALLSCSFALDGQKQASQWYFGFKTALDFLTSPPTPLPSSQMYVLESSAVISDASGNLLFYTDGDTIWNKSHVLMANGTGLAGGITCFQHLIVPQAGTNDRYYVFTTAEPYLPPSVGLCFSTVDMTLAGGSGSVTLKNQQLDSTASEQVTAVKHCNGIDYWIISTRYKSNVFLAYHLSSAGLNTVPVTSAVGPVFEWAGPLKASPSGQRLALGILDTGRICVYDFDNATGAVSSACILPGKNLPGLFNPLWCEFSADGSKLYGISYSELYQWDLCATNDSLISSSVDSMALGIVGGGMQLAIDGRIYHNYGGQSGWLGALSDPDSVLSKTSYTLQAVNTGQYLMQSLPNFPSNYFRAPLPPFSHTASCGSVSFTPPPPLCPAQSRPVTGRQWFFGDAASGNANTSSLDQPVHVYNAPGDYTVALVLHYGCGSDTIRQVVEVKDVPALTVSGPSTICAGEAHTYTAGGAVTYSWNGTAGGVSQTYKPAASAVYTLSGTAANGCAGSRVFTVAVDPCVGMGGETFPGLSVFPNPGTGIYTLRLPEPAGLHVMDLHGKLLLRRNLEAGDHPVDLSRFENGIYLLEISGDHGRITVRIHKY